MSRHVIGENKRRSEIENYVLIQIRGNHQPSDRPAWVWFKKGVCFILNVGPIDNVFFSGRWTEKKWIDCLVFELKQSMTIYLNIGLQNVFTPRPPNVLRWLSVLVA